MLTNTDFLSVGQQFPPNGEIERLQRYADNKRIFDNDHEAAYSEQWARIEKVIGNDYIQSIVTLNFQKKISLKTADFLFLEPPIYKAMRSEIEIDITAITNGLNNKGYQGAIDTSRYGTAVYKIDKDINKKGVINISSPEYLFIIVSPDDRKDIFAYALAWTYMIGDEKNKQKYLKATVHYKGSYQEYLFEMNENVISNGGTLTDNPITTGVDDFLVVPIHNLITSDSTYGIDDYMDIDSIVSEIEVRTAQINKILDAHASPTVSAPTECFEQDDKGQWRLKMGTAFPIDGKDSARVEYITWDASLDNSFKQINQLMQRLSVISEMGAALFIDNDKMGQLSGTALKKLYINVLAKVARLRNSFDVGLKEAIATASQIGHTRVDVKDISIQWQDGLPNDETEEAEIMAKRSANGRTASTESLIMKYDGKTQQEAEEEVDKITSEDMSFNMGFTPDKPSGETSDIEDTVDSDLSYNGAQIKSAIEIAQQVQAGTIARETAILMLTQFLRIAEADAIKIVDNQMKLTVPKK